MKTSEKIAKKATKKAKSKTILIVSIILILLLFLIPVLLYSSLPSEIAIHWNTKSEADDFMAKPLGIFLIPIFTLAIFLLLIFLPRIDPLKHHYKKFQNYYDGFILVMTLFMFYLQVLIILWNLDYRFNMGTMMVPALAVLFFYIGYIMPNIKRNWFIGIRTPWTLSNDKVWEKTHALGGKLFIISGIIALAGILFEAYLMWFILIPVLLTAVWVIVYSYIIWRKVGKKNK